MDERGQKQTGGLYQSPALVVMVAMTAAWLLGLPFVWHGRIGSTWLISGEVVLAGTLIHVATSFWYGTVEVSLRDASRLLLLAVGIGWAAEACGVRTGFPFGSRYVYHEAFRPQLPGEVPVAIPLAWYVLVRLPVVLLRRSEMPLWSKSMLCGIFMAGCALLLDPLGQSIGLWKFAIDDGIVLQATNALGWGSVSFLITACYFGSAKHNIRIPTSAQRQLEVLLLTMAGFFLLLALAAGASRLNAIGPLTISLALMLPCWICWWRTFQRLATFDARVQEDAR